MFRPCIQYFPYSFLHMRCILFFIYFCHFFWLTLSNKYWNFHILPFGFFYPSRSNDSTNSNRKDDEWGAIYQTIAISDLDDRVRKGLLPNYLEKYANRTSLTKWTTRTHPHFVCPCLSWNQCFHTEHRVVAITLKAFQLGIIVCSMVSFCVSLYVGAD